eukprot:TRINITY_DN10_c0_g1_i1.p1 TRINITY_DN10_c0_g1~~TRINITY_DN10_c0_g1_i1.p1  ORF type:complete len:306 (+),score=57.08 TRINITY_DN10_c0_g1_i1:47-964(+)
MNEASARKLHIGNKLLFAQQQLKALQNARFKSIAYGLQQQIRFQNGQDNGGHSVLTHSLTNLEYKVKKDALKKSERDLKVNEAKESCLGSNASGQDVIVKDKIVRNMTKYNDENKRVYSLVSNKRKELMVSERSMLVGHYEELQGELANSQKEINTLEHKRNSIFDDVYCLQKRQRAIDRKKEKIKDQRRKSPSPSRSPSRHHHRTSSKRKPSRRGRSHSRSRSRSKSVRRTARHSHSRSPSRHHRSPSPSRSRSRSRSYDHHGGSSRRHASPSRSPSRHRDRERGSRSSRSSADHGSRKRRVFK